MNQLSWTQDPEVSLARCHEGDALSTIAKKAVDSKHGPASCWAMSREMKAKKPCAQYHGYYLREFAGSIPEYR